MKRVTLLTLLAALTALSACNTMEGLGQDTQKAGQNLEKSADRNK
jgi:predicted small secreted protein